MKWYKFGFTREWDNLSLEIRNKKNFKRKSNKNSFKKGLVMPNKEIDLFCEYLNINKKEFIRITNKFRNKNIWYRENNKWKIKNF